MFKEITRNSEHPPDNESQCREIHNFCESELSKIGLSIPAPAPSSKTQIYGPDDVAEFLGVGLVKAGNKYTVKLLKQQKKKILQQLQDSVEFNQLIKNGVTIGKLSQRIEATISGYVSAYDFCENRPQLEQALDKTKAEALSKIYEQDLGINLTKLSAEQKHFLDL